MGTRKSQIYYSDSLVVKEKTQNLYAGLYCNRNSHGTAPLMRLHKILNSVKVQPLPTVVNMLLMNDKNLDDF